jgi:hypothetical protein
MAHVAFVFQVISWARTWSTCVEVKVGPFEPATPGVGSEAVVLFRMINHSGHEVKFTHVGFAPQKRKGPGFMIMRPWPLEMPAPFPIAPRDSCGLDETRPGPEGIDRDRKIGALITPSDGKTFKSKKVLARDLADGGGD